MERKEIIEETLVMVKPDGVKKGLVGRIIARIEDLGLQIKKIQIKQLTQNECMRFYGKTREKRPDIYAKVEKYMTESCSVMLIIEGENAIERVVKIRGPTNPMEAQEGTIRRDFSTKEERELFQQGKTVKNLIHASDSKKSAEFEINLLFNEK